ncbi:esterase/lipase family protein [Glaciibacter sp. 2TAF33]|uniref:esterase/lipase family protein n=1 Tax=Glaciibacter sp. 2TAF33 TaxID=3233015 RepID=UPI003F8F9567
MADVRAVPPKLMVVVPGLRSSNIQSVVDKVRATHPDYRVELVPHGIGLFSRTRTLDKASAELAHQIRGLTGENTGKLATQVVLVGHSLGGILIRKAYLYGLGYDRDSGDETPDVWPSTVTRIVLLGSPNAGYRDENIPGGPFLRVLAGLGNFAVEAVRSGGFWLANLRLRWLEVMRKLNNDANANADAQVQSPLVVQVYGKEDKVVTRADIDDSDYMPRTVRAEISTGDHEQIVDLTDPATKQLRWEELEHALFGRFPHADEHLEVSTDPVYFILHGIRASAYDGWVGDLTKELQPGQEHHRDEDRLPKVYSLSYKFFSAIEFALRRSRRANVRQFLDQYMEAILSHEPDDFAFIGHSNGTYMMASVMQQVPAVRFRRIMLAGSVLPSDFDWKGLFDNQQIGHYGADGLWEKGDVHNDQAQRDYPVGILANGLRLLGYRDIGPGGYRGFEGNSASGVTFHRTSFPRGHGAALMQHEHYPPRMHELARFLSTGQVCSEPHEPIDKTFAFWSRNAKVIIFIALLLIAIVLAGATWWLSLAIGPWALLVLGVALLLAYFVLRTF